MRPRQPSKRSTTVTVICHYEPDLARQVQALLVVLQCQAPKAAEVCGESATPLAVPTAPAVGTTGASTKTGTVTSSAANKQGYSHDTTRHPA
jgi:hypothetical protein